MARKPKRIRQSTPIFILLIIAMITATVILIILSANLVNKEPDTRPSASVIDLPTTQATEPPTTEAPEPERVIATATIGAQGDLLMHAKLFLAKYDAYCYQEDGSYDFSSIFQYLKEYTSALDYAAINLETTFGGPDYPYQGNPEFNCPDSLTDAIVDAGYDMLLTANNHASDTHTNGILRTVETVRNSGLLALGTQLSDEEDKYAIVDVNGIQIGMLCYTYADNATGDGRPSLNFREYVKQPGLVNYFTENNLPKFYSTVEAQIAQMRQQGAEAIMFYIHWGKEYQTTENATQNAIAQKLCDLGVDVIVGGHPHVVQPMELLESTVDPEHTAVCIYSLGNAVSNQMTEEMQSQKSGHTEDGVLFTVTFEKYSDGTVYLADTDVLPTWVDLHFRNGGREYNILPLDEDKADQWMELYAIPEETFADAQASFDRTMAIVGAGLEECRSFLEQAKADRESYYYDLAYGNAA